jgi:hypothetical protein
MRSVQVRRVRERFLGVKPSFSQRPKPGREEPAQLFSLGVVSVHGA